MYASMVEDAFKANDFEETYFTRKKHMGGFSLIRSILFWTLHQEKHGKWLIAYDILYWGYRLECFSKLSFSIPPLEGVGGGC